MRRRKKRFVCEICKHDITLTYKRPDELKRYVNRLGKILPRRVTKMCSKHQRWLRQEVKRARNMALLPYEIDQ